MAENPRIEELRRRVQADPASIAFAALAEEFRRVGRYDEAVATCRTGLQRHPAYLSARVTLGRALIETGDYDGAREELETVLRSAPENLAAIRGLAQIHERLGHSAGMDPHLADMMKTMHAESIRAAAERPPERVPVMSEPERPVQLSRMSAIEPEPDLALMPEPEMAADTELSLAPEMQPEPSLAPPFAPPVSMAPEPGPAAEQDAPLDVFASFAPASSSRAPAHDLSFDLSTAFSIQPATDRPAEAPIEVSMPPPLAEPVVELVPEPAFEPEPEPAIEAGPDPQILATLARLERFLGAIQSLRA
jgi:tetratricopeptide (TPR) repeat protein